VLAAYSMILKMGLIIPIDKKGKARDGARHKFTIHLQHQ
jgi:hypothetical protein